jgi:hypothetical protein
MLVCAAVCDTVHHLANYVRYDDGFIASSVRLAVVIWTLGVTLRANAIPVLAQGVFICGACLLHGFDFSKALHTYDVTLNAVDFFINAVVDWLDTRGFPVQLVGDAWYLGTLFILPKFYSYRKLFVIQAQSRKLQKATYYQLEWERQLAATRARRSGLRRSNRTQAIPIDRFHKIQQNERRKII